MGCTKTSGREFTKGGARLRTGMDKNKQVENNKAMTKGQTSETDDKLATLKSFRHDNGVCFKCGEKWGPNHKCPTHVSLHVLEELLEAMDIEAKSEEV